MSWLQILQLATSLLTAALEAFATGHRKEAQATVTLTPEHVAVLKHLAEEHAG